MSKQIAVRLPDHLVEFVDTLVRDGEAKSRAAVVTRALERERRHAIAARDVEILIREGSDPDMDSLVRYVARLPRPDLD